MNGIQLKMKKAHKITLQTLTLKFGGYLCKKCIHEWGARIYNRNGNRSGCPNCYENSHNDRK
ncbi:zinc-ribbon domain-containing protein [Peribacillus sp. NJ11]|uniref:zinc-ribbon domain-containing protein n=1 Tax=Peribacillus sp. NJ11 TaxID=3055861 RepID=UPI00338EC0FA